MNNTFPQIAFVYDRRGVASPTKAGIVEIRITYNRRQRYISTGVRLYPSQWKRGRAVACPDAIEINQMLGISMQNIRQILIDMTHEGYMDIDGIPERLRQLERGRMTFLDFCRQRAEVRKYGKRKDSQDRYDRFIRLFEEWGGITSFEDISEASIISYDKYLGKRGLKPYSKWNNYHRFLNSFILDAVDEGLLQRNPYKWINIDKGDKMSIRQRYLLPEEFLRLKSSPMPTGSIERARDVFVFQTYTCMSYSDLRNFSADRLHSIKGMKVYTSKRHKTGVEFTIPLLKPALEILEKYDGELPVISNVNYNSFLKIVAQAAGIDKPVSTHWARHTGATLLLNEGIDMKVVSKICGHSSMRITEQVYAKMLDETVVDAMARLDE